MNAQSVVELPKRLDLESIVELANNWPTSSRQITLDFRHQKFVEPAGSVGLCALIGKAKREGKIVKHRMSECSNLLYWQRVGLFDIFSEHRRNILNRETFSEILLIKQDVDLQHYIDDLVRIVTTTEDAAHVYGRIIEESLSNVIEHSEAEGFSASQYYNKGDVIRFAIADYGIGMRESLRAFGPQDDREAIELALNVGVSNSLGPPKLQPSMLRNRGIGLPVIYAATVKNGGKISILSQYGMFEATKSKRRSVTRDIRWPGTFISVEMARNEVQKEYTEAIKAIEAELRRLEKEKERMRRTRPH